MKKLIFYGLIALSTEGFSQFVGTNPVTTAADVGIGTTLPGAKLEINGGVNNISAGAIIPQILKSTTTWNMFTSSSASSNVVEIGGSYYGGARSPLGGPTAIPYFYIQQSGNVGIGTNSPQYNLDVLGSVRFSSLAGTGNRMVIADPLGGLTWQALPGLQSLSVSGPNLTISGGNTIVLPDNQNLSISGHNLSISTGNTILLPDNDNQALSISGNNLSIGGGNTITLPVTSAPTPQVLSISGSNIALSGGGGNVTVPSSADNLGNHTATADLIMNANKIKLGGTNIFGSGSNLWVTGSLQPNSAFGSFALGSSGALWSVVYSTNGTIQTSDIRFKTNIKDLRYGLKEIMKLRTITYNWKENDNGTRIGLIAQELKDVISEVVTVGDDKDKSLGVRYAELIPVLINAIKEQQAMIEDQNQKLNALVNGADKAILMNNSVQLETNVNAMLFQNNPNPFNQSSEIKYSIPSSYTSASIIICDLSGKLLKTIPLTQKGNGSILINSGELRPGILIYSLIIDGKEMGSKKMIITE